MGVERGRKGRITKRARAARLLEEAERIRCLSAWDGWDRIVEEKRMR